MAPTKTGNMSPPSDTKVCPECGETVKAAALICRFCRHDFQGSIPSPRPKFDWSRLKVPGTVVGVLIVVALLTAGVFLLIDAKAELDDSQSQLRQLESRNESTTAEIDALEAEAAELETELDKTNDANRKIERKIARVTEEAAASSSGD